MIDLIGISEILGFDLLLHQIISRVKGEKSMNIAGIVLMKNAAFGNKLDADLTLLPVGICQFDLNQFIQIGISFISFSK